MTLFETIRNTILTHTRVNPDLPGVRIIDGTAGQLTTKIIDAMAELPPAVRDPHPMAATCGSCGAPEGTPHLKGCLVWGDRP